MTRRFTATLAAAVLFAGCSPPDTGITPLEDTDEPAAVDAPSDDDVADAYTTFVAAVHAAVHGQPPETDAPVTGEAATLLADIAANTAGASPAGDRAPDGGVVAITADGDRYVVTGCVLVDAPILSGDNAVWTPTRRRAITATLEHSDRWEVVDVDGLDRFADGQSPHADDCLSGDEQDMTDHLLEQTAQWLSSNLGQQDAAALPTAGVFSDEAATVDNWTGWLLNANVDPTVAAEWFPDAQPRDLHDMNIDVLMAYASRGEFVYATICMTGTWGLVDSDGATIADFGADPDQPLPADIEISVDTRTISGITPFPGATCDDMLMVP